MGKSKKKARIGLAIYTEGATIKKRAEKRGISLEECKAQETIMNMIQVREGILLALEHLIKYEVNEDESGKVMVTGYFTLPTSEDEVNAMAERLGSIPDEERNRKAISLQSGYENVSSLVMNMDKATTYMAAKVWSEELHKESSKDV